MMMISDKQARLALDYLKTHQSRQRQVRLLDDAQVSPEFMAQVKARISQLPDTRDDRVIAAWEVMSGQVTAQDVADKMIGRLISDELS
jgi:ABC-type arginine transport system ATPase subunit